MSESKQLPYVAPSVMRLGTPANKTESGNRALSDVQPFQDDTAFGPPGPNGS